ncbi:SHOCT domain-containing protein [Streptomyces sp. NPDC000151]|uniref:SHOCT domain-containing protein n=1 Tax=Streptomyces sp. NPDC000151 TaxID=3154244 RepID=UPI00331BB3C0
MSDVMYGYGYGMSGWGYVVMIVQVLFWGMLIVGVAFLVRHLARSRPGNQAPPVHQAPEQVLAERFARGEMDEEEYRRRLSTLRGG